MTQTLAGKRAIVTGASRGIGRAICETLYAAGAEIIPVARASDAFDELIAACAERCLRRAGCPW